MGTLVLVIFIGCVMVGFAALAGKSEGPDAGLKDVRKSATE
jgi:hypothetical protein